MTSRGAISIITKISKYATLLKIGERNAINMAIIEAMGMDKFL